MPLIIEGLGDLNEILDKGFQACFEICEKLPHEFRQHAKGPSEIEAKMVETRLTGVLNDLYDAMAKTLFAVLCRMVALRGGPEKKINFYFWPGYFSLLLKRRIYFTLEATPIDERFRHVGTGFCESHCEGVIEADIKPYHDCSQARWYHYAWKQPKEFLHPHPGSVYGWFKEQRPRVSTDERDLIASLTVTTKSKLEEDREDFDAAGRPKRFQFLVLDDNERDSATWALKVADKINSALRKYVQDEKTRFPDMPSDRNISRPQTESDVRLLELGLWMNSVFSDRLPEHLPEIEAALIAAGQPKVAEQFRRAVADPVAAKIDPSEAGRLTFTDWSTISLHPMLSPPSLSSPTHERARPEISLERNSIGSAVFLSSTTLGKEFLGLVRYWVRSVYGMIRNSEILVLSHNEMLQTSRRLAMMAGPWFAHEINALLGKNTMLKTQIADCSDKAVSLRRMLFNTAESISLLAYIATNAVLDANTERIKDVQRKFLEPLRELDHDNSVGLRAALLAAARTAYDDVRTNRDEMSNGTIPALEGPHSADVKVPPRASAVCFLLVNEVITNHVRHSVDPSPGNFSVVVQNDMVHITLTAMACTGTNILPVSETLGYLNQMLTVFGIGQVTTKWDDPLEKKRFTTSISVRLSEH